MHSEHESEFRTRRTQLVRMVQGDEWAWNDFVARYRPFVLSVLQRRIWPADRARQATDDFWTYLYEQRAIDKSDPKLRFRSFLVGILRNYLKAWLREHSRGPEPLGDEELSALESDDPIPEELAIATWSRCVIQQSLFALEAANTTQARVLRSFYGIAEDLDGDAESRDGIELAAELGIELNALHGRLFRARAKLRELIEHEILRTLSRPEDLEDELATLGCALKRWRPGLATI